MKIQKILTSLFLLIAENLFAQDIQGDWQLLKRDGEYLSYFIKKSTGVSAIEFLSFYKDTIRISDGENTMNGFDWWAAFPDMGEYGEDGVLVYVVGKTPILWKFTMLNDTLLMKGETQVKKLMADSAARTAILLGKGYSQHVIDTLWKEGILTISESCWEYGGGQQQLSKHFQEGIKNLTEPQYAKWSKYGNVSFSAWIDETGHFQRFVYPKSVENFVCSFIQKYVGSVLKTYPGKASRLSGKKVKALVGFELQFHETDIQLIHKDCF